MTAPFSPYPGFDPLDSAEPHVRLSRDNPVAHADLIAEAWERGLGLAQAQGFIRRRTGDTLDRDAIRAAYVDLAETRL